MKGGPIYTHGAWWGSQEAIVKADVPDKVRNSGREIKQEPKLGVSIAATIAKLPGGPVQFGEVAYRPRGFKERPLRNVDGRAVDVSLLEWAERAVSPDRWELVDDVNGNPALVGVTAAGDAVAMVATRSSA